MKVEKAYEGKVPRPGHGARTPTTGTFLVWLESDPGATYNGREGDPEVALDAGELGLRLVPTAPSSSYHREHVGSEPRAVPMPDDRRQRLPPSDARVLWARAAALDRDRTAPRADGPLASAEARELSVEELLEVGREVGIAPDSVLLSVVEERLADGHELRPRRESPLWHRILVEIRDALEVSLQLPLLPGDTLELLGEVMARKEYRMTLEDRIGTDSRESSVSVFRPAGGDGFFDHAPFHGTLHLCDGRVLVAAVVPDGDGGSRLRIRMPLYERGVNLAISGAGGVGGGAGGVSLGATLGEALVGGVLAGATGLLPLALVVTPAVVGAYAGAGVGVLAFRKLQRWGFRKGQTALHRLARVLELEATRADT